MIERAVILSPAQTLQISQLQYPQNNIGDDGKLLSSPADTQKTHIINVLESTSLLISGEHCEASILEMHPNILRSRMSKLGIRCAKTAE